MSVLEILRWPDVRLSTVCTPVGDITPEITALAADMLQTMYAAPGRGLAAPQVGVLTRMFVMDATWKNGAPSPVVFIDPEIVDLSSQKITQAEGCLSLPGIIADVTRPAKVTLRWASVSGGQQQKTFDGFEAACVQHEMDHLDGTLTLDKISPEARAHALEGYAAVSA